MKSVVGPVHLSALVCTDRAVTNYSDGRLLKRPQNRVVRVPFYMGIVSELPQEQYLRNGLWTGGLYMRNGTVLARPPRLGAWFVSLSLAAIRVVLAPLREL